MKKITVAELLENPERAEAVISSLKIARGFGRPPHSVKQFVLALQTILDLMVSKPLTSSEAEQLHKTMLMDFPGFSDALLRAGGQPIGIMDRIEAILTS